MKRKPMILISLLLAAFVINLDTTIVNVALPTLVRELHASNSQLQWVVDAFNLLFAGSVLAVGSLSDRFGRKGMLLAGLSVFGLASLAGGLDGYLLKDADPEDVLAAVHSAAGGSMVVGRGVSAVVVAAAASAPRTDALADLDARDLEILDLMVEGLPTSQMAARLYLAPKTIRNRVSELLGKLGADVALIGSIHGVQLEVDHHLATAIDEVG